MKSSQVKSLLIVVLFGALLADFVLKRQTFEEVEYKVENPDFLEENELIEKSIKEAFSVTEPIDIFPDQEIMVVEDKRDEVDYPVITIGDVRWMIKNLNYEMEGAVCYDLEPYCDDAGKLYTYEAALRACPDGWRLPKKREWEYLIKYYLDKDAFSIQGQIVPEMTNVGLTTGGVRTNMGQFMDLGKNGYYWSQLDYDVDTAFGYQFSEDYQLVGSYQNKYAKDWQLSCLCVQSID